MLTARDAIDDRVRGSGGGRRRLSNEAVRISRAPGARAGARPAPARRSPPSACGSSISRSISTRAGRRGDRPIALTAQGIRPARVLCAARREGGGPCGDRRRTSGTTTTIRSRTYWKSWCGACGARSTTSLSPNSFTRFAALDTGSVSESSHPPRIRAPGSPAAEPRRLVRNVPRTDRSPRGSSHAAPPAPAGRCSGCGYTSPRGTPGLSH